MAYTRFKVQRVINRVRRFIDQVPLGSESVVTESSALGSPSTTISDSFIIAATNAAIKAIVGECKACHIYNAITQFNHTSTLNSQPDIASVDVVRLLQTRVWRDEGGTLSYKRAIPRSVDRSRNLEETGQPGTVDAPTYTYDDGELEIFPKLTTGDKVKLYYVGVPSVSSASDFMPLDERFEAAIVHYVAAMCYQRLQRLDLQQMAMTIYEDEIQPFLLENRLKTIDDREVEVE